MVTNAPTSENGACGHGHQRDRHCYRDIATKVVVVALLVMIASLPVAGSISTTDNTRPLGAVTAQLCRYHLAAYSLPHLPHTTDSLFDTPMKHPRNRFLRSAHSVVSSANLRNVWHRET